MGKLGGKQGDGAVAATIEIAGNAEGRNFGGDRFGQRSAVTPQVPGYEGKRP
jgi:hypothetical protein